MAAVMKSRFSGSADATRAQLRYPYDVASTAPAASDQRAPSRRAASQPVTSTAPVAASALGSRAVNSLTPPSGAATSATSQ
jgi:hypothetical protein